MINSSNIQVGEFTGPAFDLAFAAAMHKASICSPPEFNGAASLVAPSGVVPGPGVCASSAFSREETLSQLSQYEFQLATIKKCIGELSERSDVLTDRFSRVARLAFNNLKFDVEGNIKGIRGLLDEVVPL